MLNKFIGSLLVFVLLIIIGYIYNDFVLINYDYWLVKQDTIISLYFIICSYLLEPNRNFFYFSYGNTWFVFNSFNYFIFQK